MNLSGFVTVCALILLLVVVVRFVWGAYSEDEDVFDVGYWFYLRSVLVVVALVVLGIVLGVIGV